MKKYIELKDRYLLPKMSELRELGYIVQHPTNESMDILFEALTSFGSPMLLETINYKKKYTMRKATRDLLACYAYGMNHPQAIRNELDYALFQGIVNAIRDIKAVEPNEKYKPVSYKWFYIYMDKVRDTIYDEASAIANIVKYIDKTIK